MSLKEAQNIAEKGRTFGIVKRSKLFPTIDILNAFFQTGCDGRMNETNLNWPPFSLNQMQYEDFQHWCSFTCGELKVTDLECDANDHNKWFDKADLKQKEANSN